MAGLKNYRGYEMNIDELEKLARAADMLVYEIMLSDDKYMQFPQEYGLISAANPAAILALINRIRELERMLYEHN